MPIAPARQGACDERRRRRDEFVNNRSSRADDRLREELLELAQGLGRQAH